MVVDNQKYEASGRWITISMAAAEGGGGRGDGGGGGAADSTLDKVPRPLAE